MTTSTAITATARAAPMQPLPYQVTGVHRETYDTATLVLRPQAEAIPAWEPGQFTMLYAFGVGEIPVSVSGDPRETHRLVHTVRDVGAVSRALANARPGAVLGVCGPFGRGWPADDPPPRDVVIVAGGLGLAPVRPIIYRILARHRRRGRVVVVVGARTPGDLLYTGEYEAWRALGVEVRVTVDRADATWCGRVGLVTGPLAETPIDPDHTTAFVCGPEVMMTAAAEALIARAVPAERIMLSLERSMKCGIGICGHCQLGPDLICRDGPCVSYAHAAPLLKVKEL
jgi:anaerobic sulfite reductase subunit B